MARMNRELVLPTDFHDCAWEVEVKGVLRDVPVRVGTGVVKITFYDPVRLGQDLAEELARGHGRNWLGFWWCRR